jgi:hypothetical protein
MDKAKPMEIATYLLLILGVLGGADIAIYHSFAHGIRHHAGCRGELVVHSLRGPTYAALFILTPNFALHGAWSWLLVGWFVLDLAISVVDFSLEAQSRRFLGGLPTGEYLLHILLAMLFGGLVMAVGSNLGDWMLRPTRLLYQPVQVAVGMRWVMLIMAALVLWSGVQDGIAAIRLSAAVRRPHGDARAWG